MGLEKGGVDLDDRLVRVVGKGGKERVVPLGREAAEALRRYLARGRPHLDRRHRPELFLNAKGGALTRAGAFLILRRLAAAAGPRARARPSAPAPPLVRDAPARGRRRPPQRPGDARPRRPRHDRALHARHRPAPAGVVLRRRIRTRGARGRPERKVARLTPSGPASLHVATGSFGRDDRASAHLMMTSLRRSRSHVLERAVRNSSAAGAVRAGTA